MAEENTNLNPSKGGLARAEKLSPDHRKEIAQKAAEARWGPLPQAILESSIIIVQREVACAVLENGQRLLTQETFLMAIGRAGKAKGGQGSVRLAGSVDGLPPFLAANNLRPFINTKLRESTTPIVFRSLRGNRAFGYDARLLPMVCEVYLKARDARVLTTAQEHIAVTCDVLMRGLAHVGIIALVDEATGYQDLRTQSELNQLLEMYVQEELRPYISRFPNEFFKQIYKIYGWPYKAGSTKRPPLVGKFINEYVYRGLPPNVLPKLQELNPVTDKGWRRWKHFQFMPDTGSDHLDKQIVKVTTLMEVSDNKREFDEFYNKACAPAYQQRLPLVLDVDTGERKKQEPEE
jgi:P63C domain-containing protein